MVHLVLQKLRFLEDHRSDLGLEDRPHPMDHYSGRHLVVVVYHLEQSNLDNPHPPLMGQHLLRVLVLAVQLRILEFLPIFLTHRRAGRQPVLVIINLQRNHKQQLAVSEVVLLLLHIQVTWTNYYECFVIGSVK